MENIKTNISLFVQGGIRTRVFVINTMFYPLDYLDHLSWTKTMGHETILKKMRAKGHVPPNYRTM